MTSENRGLVLVVDDAPAYLSLVTAVLTETGYQVRAANSGLRALSVTENVLPDLILLDVKMPDMDGFETCTRLKQNPVLEDVPVVFMSGLDETEAKVRGFDVGATDFISKPFEPQELLARVGTHIGLAQARRELADANERLKELDQMKSSFIASVNHELRTPLNSIIGFTGIILEGMCGELTEIQENYLTRVNKAAWHLLEVIAEIIDISRIDGKRFDIKLQDVDIPVLIETALDTVRPQAQDKGLNLEAQCPEGLIIRTDRRRLLQCLVNFLGNGVKYTGDGSVSLQTSVTGDRVEFKVVDTGPGFTEAEAGQLFTAFGRLQSARESQIEGTGLGLFVTKKIADEILLGEVSAHPNKARGCTFTLTLPLTRPETDSTDDQAKD